MRAFTLIETVIYIALLSILLTGAVAATYGIVSSAQSLETLNTTQDEGTFVMQKLDWALSGADVVSTPSSGSSDTLVLTRYDGDTITFRRNGTAIEMRTNSGSYVPLTSSNVSATALSFVTSAGTPTLVAASTTLSGTTFKMERLTY